MNEQKAVPFRYLTKVQRDIVRRHIHEKKGALVENVEEWSWLFVEGDLPRAWQHIGVASGPQQQDDA